MSTPYTESRKSLTAKLHIARKDLGLDDDTYRAMLEHLTGHRSSKECTDRQLVMVIASLRRRGWNPDPSTYRKTEEKKAHPGKTPKVRPEYEPLLTKIHALILDTGTTWAYAEGIAMNMYRVGLSWCDATQLRGVVTALVKHRQVALRKAAAQLEGVA